MGMYRTTIHGSLYGQTVDVIMGWITGGATSSANAATLAQRVENYWAADVMVDLAADYSTTSVDAVGMDDPTQFGTFPSTSTGGVVANASPVFVVGNVSLQTGLRGRSYTGRFGIPGLLRTHIEPTNSNLLTAAAQALLQGDVSSFISDLSGGSLPATLAVISTISGGTPRATPIATAVTTATLRLPLGSRVSRKD